MTHRKHIRAERMKLNRSIIRLVLGLDVPEWTLYVFSGAEAEPTEA